MDTESVMPSKKKSANKKANETVNPELAPSDNSVRTKLLLNMENEHPLSVFQNELKIRGIKNVDLNEFVVLALSQVPAAWWQTRIEELTPLEYRVNNALSDPNLRQKLSDLLNPQQAN